MRDKTRVFNEIAATHRRPRQSKTDLRVMQWNLLANALSLDGFLTPMVSTEFREALVKNPPSDDPKPDPKNYVPVNSDRTGFAVARYSKMLSDIKRISSLNGDARISAIQSFRDRYDTATARRNLAYVVDRRRRTHAMMARIREVDPDIITVQELDTFVSLSAEMEKHGYTAYTGRNAKYTPLCDRPPGAYASRLACPSSTACFAPKSNSTAFGISAARAAKPGARMSRSDVRSLRDKTEGLTASASSPCATRRELTRLGSKIESIDDDGCAVFWKTSRLEAVGTPTLLPIDTHSGAASIALRDRVTGATMRVVTTHLRSGRKDTQKRALQVRSLRPLLVGDPRVILGLDANADPFERPIATGDAKKGHNTIGLIRAFGMRSCWDTALSKAREQGQRFPYVTVNKVRGAASDQPRKIGDHALATIDYVCYGAGFSQRQFAVEPRSLGGNGAFAQEALSALIPNEKMPSDHYPVIVDFAYAEL